MLKEIQLKMIALHIKYNDIKMNDNWLIPTYLFSECCGWKESMGPCTGPEQIKAAFKVCHSENFENRGW